MVFFGCFAPEERLTQGDLALVDSLYLEQRESILDQLADSCQIMEDQLLEHLVDSIYAERLAEIQHMINQQ